MVCALIASSGGNLAVQPRAKTNAIPDQGKRRMALLMSWMLLGNKISEDKKSAVRKAYNDGHGVDISANPDAEVKLPEAL